MWQTHLDPDLGPERAYSKRVQLTQCYGVHRVQSQHEAVSTGT